MKDIVITIGGILLALGIVSAIFFGSFKPTATTAANTATEGMTETLKLEDWK